MCNYPERRQTPPDYIPNDAHTWQCKQCPNGLETKCVTWLACEPYVCKRTLAALEQHQWQMQQEDQPVVAAEVLGVDLDTEEEVVVAERKREARRQRMAVSDQNGTTCQRCEHQATWADLFTTIPSVHVKQRWRITPPLKITNFLTELFNGGNLATLYEKVFWHH